MLTLEKGGSLSLEKSKLNKITIGAGWDVSEGKSVDLDIFLIPEGGKTLFFNQKSSTPGCTISDDDTTGATSDGGADETINIDLSKLTSNKYTVGINIYNAAQKGQKFADIKRAFFEVVNADTKEKLATYNISESGGNYNALIGGTLTREGDNFSFKAVGEFMDGDIISLSTKYGANN